MLPVSSRSQVQEEHNLQQMSQLDSDVDSTGAYCCVPVFPLVPLELPGWENGLSSMLKA